MKSVSEKEISSTKKETKKSDSNETIARQKNTIKNSSGKKELDTTKLLYFVIGIIIIGIVILYASGTFDEPAAVTVTEQVPDDHVHSGADLTKVNEINALEEEVKNNPKDLTKIAQLGHLLNDSGFYERAIEKYKMYLEIKPDDADVLVDMGVCYFELKDYTNAISAMEKGISLNPKHQIGHFNLGVVNISSGNKEKAIEYWKKCIELDPNSNIAQRAKELLNNN